MNAKFLSLTNISSKITIRIAKIIYINRVVTVNICFDSNGTFSNNEIFGTISYSSEKVDPTNDIFCIGGGSGLVFGFGVESITANILDHGGPNHIKATQYAGISCVYYTNKKL